ncbi:restriction endonuclease [Sphingomonas hengshuiensis]|uniref:Restriction endonuclease n=1 Tax=Sphingomonas hengshuiensis TaxID=1609977 RepID=A0A7U5CUJ1_9SPHN|nr:restriction endonuclease [Sphingomonas hengshuiensis]AJP70756.1 restriction endonuclease [Sphingomonas hengshuiensis]
MTRLWIARAGRNGERELDAIQQGKLMLGFNEVDDLSLYQDRAAILAHLEEAVPDASANRRKNFAAQLNQFAHVIQIGDLVVLPRKLTSGVAIGEVTGPYKFEPDGISKQTRAVKWLNEAVPRDAFKQDLRHSFGAFMTVCEIKRNQALERVKAVLATGRDPGALLGKQGTATVAASDEVVDADDIATDIEDVANQQIISLIKSEFAGHALANLVAEILEVEGYTTKVSPPGADGGVDILAAGGTLGLGEDRICVQVKSGDGAANHDVVLRLIGSVSNSQARTGLLVSIGGVNAVAQKELDNNFFKLRLWQMPDLLKALFRTYAQLPVETRAKLPLKQIWAPLAGPEA